MNPYIADSEQGIVWRQACPPAESANGEPPIVAKIDQVLYLVVAHADAVERQVSFKSIVKVNVAPVFRPIGVGRLNLRDVFPLSRAEIVEDKLLVIGG